MASGSSSFRKQKLAKVAIAKSNAIKIDVGTIAGETVVQHNSLSQSLGVSYNSSGAVVTNNTTDKLSSIELHGVISGMDITINANPRYFDIGSGVYYINGARINYTGGQVDTLAITSGFASAIINNGGTVTLLPQAFPSSSQLNDGYLELTAFTKIDANTIGNIGASFFESIDFIKKIYIRHKLFEGTIFSLDAGKITLSTTPLQLDIDAGEINTPNAEVKAIASQANITAQKMYHLGGTYTLENTPTTLVVDVAQYDNGTDLVAIPNNKYIVHTVSRSSRTDAIYFTYGKTVYSKLSDALLASYDLGIFDGDIGSEVEPLALIVVDQGTSSIAEVIDIRNNTNTLSSGSATQDLGWKDNIIPFGLAGKANSAPSEVTDSNGWRRLSFAEGNGVYLDFHVDHDYARGTDAYPHIHWMPTTTMTAGQTVVWEIGYIVARGHQQGDSLLATPITMTLTHTADGTEVAGEHMVTECSDLDAFDLIEPDTIISMSVTRGNGTYNSAVYGLMADLHYQSDRDSTINKSPNFYA